MKTFWRWMAAVMVGGIAAQAADITPGYTFSSGEANVTHTKLNNSAAGTINTSFYSGKGSAGTDPNTAFTILIHNTTLDTYQKMTISSLLDHASLLTSRTVATAPAVDDLVLVYDASAGSYRAMSWTNWLFGGTATSAPTNETRFPVLHGGVPSSVTLSNVIAGLTSHALPTNGDALMVLTASGRAVKQMALESIVKDQTAATNWGNYQSVAWDGTRLRSAYETNKIDGLGVTNTVPTTNDAFAMLQDGAMKKLFLSALRDFVNKSAVNLTQSVYSVTTNISASSGNWSNVVDIGTSSLTATLVPRSTAGTTKVLVRLVLNATSQGGGDNGYVQVLRGGVAIGVGASDGANRVEAGASIGNTAEAGAVVYEYLDTTGTTNTTYSVQLMGVSGNTLYLNRDSSDANSTANGRYISTMTLTEILQ